MEIGGIFRDLLCLQCGKLGLQLGQLFLRRFGASQQLRVLVSGYGSGRLRVAAGSDSGYASGDERGVLRRALP